MFSANTYIERRNILKKQMQSGVLLFLGNDDSPMNYLDNPYHFRQDSTFLYYFGLNNPGLSAIIDVDENLEIIFGDELTIEDIVWMGYLPTIVDRSSKVGIQDTRPLTRLSNVIQTAKEKNRKIHFLPPYRTEHRLKLFKYFDLHPDQVQDSASLELIKAVVNQRNYKSKEEIAEIEKSANVAVDMHVAAMRMAKPDIKESEIAAEVHRIAMDAGGNISFPVIATIHGETLHNHYHGNILKEGDLFLLDIGAETEMGYASDLSSTFPVSKTFTAKQKEIYEIALSAHNAAVEKLKPNVPFKKVHLTACKTITEGLKSMGFMKGDVDDAVAAGAHALFFPCGTGHMMGLDVHDMENLGEVYVGYDGKPKSTQFGLKSLRLARPLEPGFVVTIEPGIYFVPQLIDLWKKERKFTDFIDYEKVESYKGFGGLRNEENFVITNSGCRRLGKSKPKTIQEVEHIRKSNR